MIKKDQHCFANISATKAQIFMILYLVVNYYLVGLSLKFHEDPCINARTQVVNVLLKNLIFKLKPNYS